MKDGIVKVCVAILNLICVVLLCCEAGAPQNSAQGVLRAGLVVGYFISFLAMSIGEDNNENNNGED